MRERFSYLDGLRGWAAVCVLLYHVFVDGLPLVPEAGRLPAIVIFNGQIAVFVFFLISGFSLSVGYLSTADMQGWLRIATARYFRLVVPIFAICVIAHLAMIAGLLQPVRGFFAFEPTIGHLMAFSLFDVFFRYDGLHTYVGPLWTMAPELYGSALTLLTAIAVRSLPFPLRVTILVTLSAAIFYFPSAAITKMLALFPLGVVMADATLEGYADRISHLISLSMLAVGCAIPALVSPSFLAWGMIASPLVMIGCIATPAIRGFFSNGISQWLGWLSFPLYLVHGPVLCIVGIPLMQSHSSIVAGLAIELLVIAVSILTAIPFAKWINDPAVTLARRFGQFVTRSIGDRDVRRKEFASLAGVVVRTEENAP